MFKTQLSAVAGKIAARALRMENVFSIRVRMCQGFSLSMIQVKARLISRSASSWMIDRPARFIW